MKLIVPAYFYPVRPGDWDTLITTTPGLGEVIVNDRSGALAGQTADPAYTTVIADANTAGLSLLYYVDTDYAGRMLAAVKADMDAWVSLYGAPAGWFFDQASSSATDIPYYQDLYDYAAGLRVVLNHGTTPDETYISLSGPDLVCDTSIIAETDATTLATWSWPSWLTTYTRDRFGVIVHDAATGSDLTAAWSTIAAQWVEWAFVTSGTYTALPSYWSDELALDQIVVTGGGDLTAAAVKHAVSFVDTGTIYGVATYGQSTYGGHLPGLHLHGGGTPVATGWHVRPFVLDGGGDIAMAGHKAATAVADLPGGGYLWGPFPFILDPALRILTPGCKVARRRGEGHAKVLHTSIRVPVH